MIYTIPTIIITALLAWLFRDELTDDISLYLATVCLGGIFWPVTIILAVKLFFDWRRG